MLISNHELARAIHKGMAIDYSRQSTERAKKNDIVKFGMCSVCIRKVIFNDHPATVVLWSDGTKTVVKCGPDDIFDKEKGLAMAIVKKMAGNDSRFHKVFKKWCKPDETNEVAGKNECGDALKKKSKGVSIMKAKVNIDNTRFIFDTNFSGDPNRDRYGSSRRRVNVVIPTEEQAQQLIEMGLNVKQTKPNPNCIYDEPFVPTFYVPVTVNMDSKWPPQVFWITTTGRKVACNAENIGQLDYIRVKNVNLQANLYENRNNPGQYTLYADILYVEQDADADPYAAKYEQRETAEPNDPNDLPY